MYGITSGSAEAIGATYSRDNTPDYAHASGFDALVHEIQELQENQGPFEKRFENLKAIYQREYTIIVDALQEEQYRCKLLEEQLNDLTELHMNEILILKEELAGMEEKLAYMAYATDICEALEACQTRLFKMEQQQVVHLEGLEHDTAEILLGNVVKVLLALMAVLAFVYMVGNCLIPLLKTCRHCFLYPLGAVGDAFLEYLNYLFCMQHPEEEDH
uniref:transmembrane and coiled-coil domains protein 1-like n=1 Tax=Semicossyphus pulcher TaxID=241346 RepID=UPI0037E77B2C